MFEVISQYLEYLEIEKGLAQNTIDAYRRDLYSFAEIADELETDLSIIEQIYEVIENASPESTEKELLDILMSKNILQFV